MIAQAIHDINYCGNSICLNGRKAQKTMPSPTVLGGEGMKMSTLKQWKQSAVEKF